MSDNFNLVETSESNGRPVTLYEFILPPATTYRYCASALPVAVNQPDLLTGVTTRVEYAPAAIRHEGIVQSGESVQDNFTLVMPDDLPIPQMFRGRPPMQSVRLIVREIHYGEEIAVVQWVGHVYEVSRPEIGKAQITCAPLSNTLRRDALRLSWSRQCPHMVYDAGCRANPNSFSDTLRVLAIEGSTVTYERVSGLPVLTNQHYYNGFLQFVVSGETIMTAIDFHDGNKLNVLSTRGLTVGLQVLAYKGCNRTAGWCNSVFGNLANFGGFEKIPGKSPFSTNPTF